MKKKSLVLIALLIFMFTITACSGGSSSTDQPTSLVLSSSSPQDGASDIAVSLSQISLNFNSELAEGQGVLKVKGGAEVTDIDISKSDQKLMISNFSLEGNTTYVVNYTAKNTDGKSLSGEISFTTEQVSAPLILSSSSPQDGASAVETTLSQISLDFSNELVQASGKLLKDGTEVSGVSISKTGTKMLVEGFNLSNNSIYKIDYTVEDNQGEKSSGTIRFTTPVNSVLPNISTDNMNHTMMQTFYWEMNTDEYATEFPEEANLWDLLADRADTLSQLGITSLWLPPANKAMSETADVGYATYDLWDLGEFYRTVNSSVKRTKYGTLSELQTAVDTLHSNNIKVYYDAVLNQRMGADTTEQVTLSSNSPDKAGETIEAWTNFNMQGRSAYYSQADQWSWNWQQFDAVDWDQATETSGEYLFEGKTFDDAYDNDYLMGADVDYENQNVVDEVTEWGAWITGERNNSQVEFDGFRLDAVKHVENQFVSDWISSVQSANSSEDIFFVGEAWYENVNDLVSYLDKINNPNLKLFDFALRSNFAQMVDGSMDMSQLGNAGLVNESGYENRAVTFVDNHDTDRDEETYTSAISRRKYQSYAYILMRKHGLPTIYWKDYYIWGMKPELDKLLEARKHFAYGASHEVRNNDADVYSYVREGLDSVPGTGLVMMISDDDSGDIVTKKINSYQPNTKFYDYTGNVSGIVKTDDQGYGEFKLREDEAVGSNTAHGWSVWVPIVE